MNAFLRLSGSGFLAATLVFSPIALAGPSYENDMGQSAQMSHTIQDQDSRSATRIDDSDRQESPGEKGGGVVEDFRDRNALGQSDAMSKTQPYVSLTKTEES